MLACDTVMQAVQDAAKQEKYVAAICAAPSILGHCGLLKGKKATCYPGFENELKEAVVTNDGVVVDGNVITASGAGVAVDFALALVEYLVSREAAEAIRGGIQCR